MKKFKVTFLGATQSVTGSRYLVEANGSRLLVDCGLFQEREFASRNWDPFPLPPNSLDAVLVTHAHLDHSGYLPRLVKEGFHGKIYCTAPTADIAKILLEDSGRIQEEDAQFKKRRHEREGRRGPREEAPLYTADDALAIASIFSPVKYSDPLKLGDGVTAVFHNAGHILGSASIRIIITDGSESRSIVFSGDLGQRDMPVEPDPEVYRSADYVVVESTYGNRLHEEREDLEQHVARIVNETVQAGGNLIIPSFAVERAQEILYLFKRLVESARIPRMMVFVDSPMATDVTAIFEKYPDLLDEDLTRLLRYGDSPFRFQGLTMVKTVEQSKAINVIKGSVVVIAGAGMCNGGRVKHHLVNNISHTNSTVLFVGYQANGTLGRRIVDGDSPVRVLGGMYDVKARIEQIYALSAHADQKGLLHWLKSLKTPPRRVFAVHGEEETAKEFAEEVRKQTGWDVTVPYYKQEFTLD